MVYSRGTNYLAASIGAQRASLETVEGNGMSLKMLTWRDGMAERTSDPWLCLDPPQLYNLDATLNCDIAVNLRSEKTD